MHARKTVSVTLTLGACLALIAGSPQAADNYLDALSKESAPAKSGGAADNTVQAGGQSLPTGLKKPDFEAALRSAYPSIHREYLVLKPEQQQEVYATYKQFPSINAIRPRIADFAK